MAQYEIEILAEESKQSTLHWLTCSFYPAHKIKKIYRQSNQILLDNPDLASRMPLVPLAYLSEFNLLIQSFPLDRYLPALPALLFDPPMEIKSVILNAFDRNVKSEEYDWRVQAKRYRPHIGASLHYKLYGKNSGEDELNAECYIKTYKENAQTIHDKWIDSFNYCELNANYFQLVKPIACMEKYQAIIIETAQGISLDEILNQELNIKTGIGNVAKALAEFHLSKMPCQENDHREDALRQARKAGEMIKSFFPHLAEPVNNIIMKISNELSAISLLPCHQDMKLEHIFLHDSQVTFIDLDSSGLGDPVYDIATLITQMRELAYLQRSPPPSISQAEQSLLDEYFNYVPENWRSRLPYNLARAYLKNCLFYIQHQTLGWEQRITHLLANLHRLPYS